MFLENLKQPSVRALFLELSVLVMMTEGNKENTSYRIKNLNLDEQIRNFWQNIEDKEVDILIKNAKEISKKDYTDFINNSDFNSNNILEKLFSKNESYYLVNILNNQTKLVLEECNKLESFKKEIIQEISLSNEYYFSTNHVTIKNFMLKNKNIRQDILTRTADGIFENREVDFDSLSSKEKKIVLYKLIQSGYINGQFDDNKKILLLRICKLLNVDSEYFEEFLEVTKSLFAINKNLAILINE